MLIIQYIVYITFPLLFGSMLYISKQKRADFTTTDFEPPFLPMEHVPSDRSKSPEYYFIKA